MLHVTDSQTDRHSDANKLEPEQLGFLEPVKLGFSNNCSFGVSMVQHQPQLSCIEQKQTMCEHWLDGEPRGSPI